MGTRASTQRLVGAIRILVKVQSEVHLLDLLQGLAQLVQSSARWHIIPSGTVAVAQLLVAHHSWWHIW
jgi:hypothetical protein